MGTLFLVCFLVIDFGVYQYLLANGHDPFVVNRVCTGALFIALAIQIAITWSLNNEYRVFYLSSSIESKDDRVIASLSIVGLSLLGVYMIIGAIT